MNFDRAESIRSLRALRVDGIKVLDHGYVKLVDSMGTDESIIEAARMSTGRGFVSWDPYKRCKACDTVMLPGEELQKLTCKPFKEDTYDTDPPRPHEWQDFPNGDTGTLDFLWRHKHATPFEMCELAIEVQVPLFVRSEWHRHRTQSYNEFSARYSVMPNLHYMPEPSRFKSQSSTNKQGSSEESLAAEYTGMAIQELKLEQDQIYAHYEQMLDEGVAKEVARVNTPLSRYTRFRAKTDLRNWLAFLNLRMRPNAQQEIREYANAVAEIVKALYPKTGSLFEEYDLYSASFGRQEMEALRKLLTGIAGIPESNAAYEKLTGSKLKEFTEKIIHGGKKIL